MLLWPIVPLIIWLYKKIYWIFVKVKIDDERKRERERIEVFYRVCPVYTPHLTKTKFIKYYLLFLR